MLPFLGDWLAGSHQVFQIESDGLLCVGDAFFGGLTLCDAFGQSRHGYGVPAFRVRVDNYRVGAHIGPNLQQTAKLLGVDSCLIEDRQKGLRLEDRAGVNRHHDSPRSALIVEHDVASTPPHVAPTGLAEGAVLRRR
jgi:hypothetical protein